MSGDIEKGMAMLREAGAGGAVRPSWHYVYLFIGSYMTGQMTEAIGYANAIPNDNTALGQVAQVLAADAAGKPDDAKKAADRLRAIGPGLGQEPAPGALPNRRRACHCRRAGQGACQGGRHRRVLTGFALHKPRQWKIIVFAGLFSLGVRRLAVNFLPFRPFPATPAIAGASFGWPARLQAEWFKTVSPFGSVHIFYRRALRPEPKTTLLVVPRR